MGVNARKAIDPRWTKHHVQTVSDFMLADIRVIRKSPTVLRVYDQATGKWNTNGFSAVFAGKARIQPYGIIGDQIVAQDTTGRRLMRVQIKEKLSGINLDDMLIIDSSPDSPELTGFTLEVRGTIGSSNAWITDLVCEADLKREDNRYNPPVDPTDPGDGGGGDNEEDLFYQFTQIVPANSWIIPIPPNFTRTPVVTVRDTAGHQMIPDVSVSSTTVTISFPIPTAGTALLN